MQEQWLPCRWLGCWSSTLDGPLSFIFMVSDLIPWVPMGNWASWVARWWRIPCQYRRFRKCRSDPWVGKIPWRREWQPTSIFLPGNDDPVCKTGKKTQMCITDFWTQRERERERVGWFGRMGIITCILSCKNWIANQSSFWNVTWKRLPPLLGGVLDLLLPAISLPIESFLGNSNVN